MELDPVLGPQRGLTQLGFQNLRSGCVVGVGLAA